MLPSYERRQDANEESKNHAERYREPWSIDELDQLCANWDGTDETLEVIAFCLGRTIEACRQRYYEHNNGAPLAEKPVKVRKIEGRKPQFSPGWLVGMCQMCRRITDVYMDRHGTKLCEECDL
jgi:hypothetical protein